MAALGYNPCPLRHTPGVLREGEIRYTWGTLPTDYTFTGQRSEMDAIGLIDYNARWYDPALGRFVIADTVIPREDPKGLRDL